MKNNKVHVFGPLGRFSTFKFKQNNFKNINCTKNLTFRIRNVRHSTRECKLFLLYFFSLDLLSYASNQTKRKLYDNDHQYRGQVAVNMHLRNIYAICSSVPPDFRVNAFNNKIYKKTTRLQLKIETKTRQKGSLYYTYTLSMIDDDHNRKVSYVTAITKKFSFFLIKQLKRTVFEWLSS